MAASLRLAALALCAALAMLGLALGAESQGEVFLEPDLQARDQANASGAAGNLVALTGLLVALGATGAGLLLSGGRPVRRLAAGAVLFGSSYLAIFLAQSAWPNYNAAIEARYADLANSLLTANVSAVPSLLVPVLALAVAAILGAGWAVRRLLGERGAREPKPHDLLVRQVAAVLLAAPFLLVAAWGNLRLLLGLPDSRPGLGPYFVVLPLMALLCLGLLATGLVKAWRLGSFVRNGRLAAAVQESWQATGRAEAAIGGALVGLACLASLFSALDLPQLDLGRVFTVSLRGHTQLLLLLAIPLAPAALHHRVVARYLENAPVHRATLETGTDPLAVAALVATCVSFALCGLATWLAPQALWAWLFAAIPVTVLACLRCGPVPSAPAALLLGFLLWSIGNTVVAHYDGGDEAILQFRDPPGLLALWRTLGAIVAGFAMARLALSVAPDERPGLAGPLALGVGGCLAAVALLEMPLAAWLLNRGDGEAIAVGSVVASQDLPVRILLHAVAGVLSVAAALLLARLRRPDWFKTPPPPPLAAVVRSKTRRAAAKPSP